MEILAILMLIFAPIIAAILLGLLQLLIYKILAWVRIISHDRIPMFPILLFRGLIILLALIALMAIGTRFFTDGTTTGGMSPGATP